MKIVKNASDLLTTPCKSCFGSPAMNRHAGVFSGSNITLTYSLLHSCMFYGNSILLHIGKHNGYNDVPVRLYYL